MSAPDPAPDTAVLPGEAVPSEEEMAEAVAWTSGHREDAPAEAPQDPEPEAPVAEAEPPPGEPAEAPEAAEPPAGKHAAAPEPDSEPEAPEAPAEAPEPEVVTLAAVPEPEHEPDGHMGALAASVAARLKEVDRWMAAARDEHAEADRAFSVGLDGDLADARRRVAAYPTGWIGRIDGYCAAATAAIAVMCSQDGRAAA